MILMRTAGILIALGMAYLAILNYYLERTYLQVKEVPVFYKFAFPIVMVACVIVIVGLVTGQIQW